MKKLINLSIGMLAMSAANAESLVGVDEMICSTAQAQICLENGQCFAVTLWELSVPDFVVIDTRKKTVSTTAASQLN